MHMREAGFANVLQRRNTYFHMEAPLFPPPAGGLHEAVTEVSCEKGREKTRLLRGALWERCFLLGRGEKDEVVLKRCSGLHQNTPCNEFEWRLVMSPSGEGSRIQARLLRP